MTYVIYILASTFELFICWIVKKKMSGPDLNWIRLIPPFLLIFIFGTAHYGIAFKGVLVFFESETKDIFGESMFFRSASFCLVIAHSCLMPEKT